MVTQLHTYYTDQWDQRIEDHSAGKDFFCRDSQGGQSDNLRAFPLNPEVLLLLAIARELTACCKTAAFFLGVFGNSVLLSLVPTSSSVR